jgi:predicted Zn finger-like uncharacterized protein
VSYRTTCPHCASVFRLGADQLEAAQGWAQCGVCGAAFDARSSLLMEDGSPLPAATAPAEIVEPVLAETVEPVAAETTAPDDTLPVEVVAPVSPPLETWGEPAPPASAEPEAETPPATEPPVGIARRESSLDLSSIIILDPNLPASDDYGPLPEIPDAPPLMYPPAAAPAAPAKPAGVPPAVKLEYSRAWDAPPKLGSPHITPAPRRAKPWGWRMAGALLLVLLLAQSAYFLRDTLVSQLPQSRPVLEQACAVLGCTLSLPKNPALLQIVGADLQTEAHGGLKLILTLGNRADHAQAWPMLVLTLTDQRNRPLARRSFAPGEYLDDPQRVAAGIPPRTEQALSLPLSVRDLAPMGFDLQLTY